MAFKYSWMSSCITASWMLERAYMKKFHPRDATSPATAEGKSYLPNSTAALVGKIQRIPRPDLDKLRVGPFKKQVTL